jgi:trans-aconitate methyltransferase
VPQLTSTVVKYLNPQPTDNILDIGCGDGVLTAQIAAMVPQGSVLGLDASASMIAAAKEKSSSSPNCVYRVQNCATLLKDAPSDVLNGAFDKVFSNAALHWIMHDPKTRTTVFKAAMKALKPGGMFVFEMGGAGNVAEIHAVVTAALVAHGIPIAEAREAAPWFFPSEAWVRRELERDGFAVETVELEYRPTKLNPRTEDGKGGIEGWLRLMCATQFEKLETEQKKEEVLSWVADMLDTVITREEDGSQWLGYVRLRAIARKIEE